MSFHEIPCPRLSQFVVLNSQSLRFSTDNDAQAESMDPLWYSNKYGLMDSEIYDVLWNNCRGEFLNKYDIRHRPVEKQQQQRQDGIQLCSLPVASCRRLVC